ncbi:MAG: hypothetical protein J0H67_12080 [Rhodospirillales bacterium]|nr:hypothetical protein [Rhodospirillales bacterium]
MHWPARALLILGIVGLAAVALLHAGLIPRGAWGADEFQTFGMFRAHGWQYLWFRFISWSPRPFSEALIALYAALVRATGRPHIVVVLGIVWAAAVLALLPALSATRGIARAYRLLGALAVLCVVILGRDVASVFYWPFGAVAYAPVVTVAMVLLFRAATPAATTLGNRGVTAALLIAAAWASETGAMLVVVHTALLSLWLAWHRRPIRPDTWLPLLAGAGVIGVLVAGHRIDMAMLPGGSAARFHHPFASLAAAAQQLIPEALALDISHFTAGSLLGGTLVKLAFFLGIQGCWMTADPARRGVPSRLAVVAVSFPLTCFLILLASYYQYGLDCCDRHAFVRQALWFMAVAALAIWTAPHGEPGRGWRGVATPIALLLAVGLLLAPRSRAIWQDWRDYQDPMIARGLTWQSGRSPGPDMTIYQVRKDPMTYRLPDHADGCVQDWWAASIGWFFPGKTCIRVVTGAAPP